MLRMGLTSQPVPNPKAKPLDDGWERRSHYESACVFMLRATETFPTKLKNVSLHLPKCVLPKRKLKNVSGHHKLQQAGVKSKNCNSLNLLVCLSLNLIVKPARSLPQSEYHSECSIYRFLKIGFDHSCSGITYNLKVLTSYLYKIGIRLSLLVLMYSSCFEPDALRRNWHKQFSNSKCIVVVAIKYS